MGGRNLEFLALVSQNHYALKTLGLKEMALFSPWRQLVGCQYFSVISVRCFWVWLVTTEHFLCLFYWIIGHCVSSLERCLFRYFAHFSFVFLLLSCKSSLIYSTDRSLIGDMICKYFLPLYRLSFHFDGVLWSTKVFNFDDTQFIYFFFFFACALVSYLRIHVSPCHEDLLVCFLPRMYSSIAYI